MAKNILSVHDIKTYSTVELLYKLANQTIENTAIIEYMVENGFLETDEQMEQSILIPSGEDDTQLIQSLLNEGKNIVSVPNQTYHTSQPLYLKHDNQVLDFNGSTLIFSQDQSIPHTTDSERTNQVGILNIRTTNYQDSVNVTSADIKNGVMTLDSVSNIQVHDYFVMNISCYGTVYHEEYLSPRLNTLVQILQVNHATKEVQIDYSCEAYDIPSSDFTGTLQKIVPLSGCQIKNVKLIDQTPLRNNWVTSTSTPYPTEDSHYACCGIGVENATNIKIENVSHEYGLFSTVHATCISHSEIKGLSTYAPRLYGGGEGYCIQNIFCHDMTIQNLKGYRTRHTLDISGGGYYNCLNIQSIQSYSSDIQFHGQYEHNIVIDGVKGDGLGHALPFFNSGSGTEFGQCSADVIFKNSQLRIIPSMSTCCIKNLVYDNCQLSMHRLTNQVRCSNCQIELSEMTAKVPIKRGLKTYLALTNCQVTLTANNTIALYDEVLISNCSIHNQTDIDGDIGISLVQCGDTTISNNTINACLWLSNDDTTYGQRYTTHTITGNLFHCYKYGGIFFKDSSASQVYATIVGNQFYQSRELTSVDYQPYWLDFDGNSRTDSVLRVLAVGNVAPTLRNFASGVNNANALITMVNNME